MLAVVVLSVASLFTAVILKKDKPEYATLVIIFASICIAVKILSIADELVSELHDWESFLSGYKVYINLFIKMLGITYICEFASDLCKDAGHQTLSNHIEIFGKVTIMVAGLPIIKTVFGMIEKLLKI